MEVRRCRVVHLAISNSLPEEGNEKWKLCMVSHDKSPIRGHKIEASI